MAENLPPLPGTEEPPTNTSLIAYILRGREWVEIGIAKAHPDGKGHQLRLEIAPVDGEVIELRAVDSAYYPGHQRAPRARRGRTFRPRPRT
jgi:hypothetical protein